MSAEDGPAPVSIAELAALVREVRRIASEGATDAARDSLAARKAAVVARIEAGQSEGA